MVRSGIIALSRSLNIERPFYYEPCCTAAMNLPLRRTLVPQTSEGALPTFVLYSPLGDGAQLYKSATQQMFIVVILVNKRTRD